MIWRIFDFMSTDRKKSFETRIYFWIFRNRIFKVFWIFIKCVVWFENISLLSSKKLIFVGIIAAMSANKAEFERNGSFYESEKGNSEIYGFKNILTDFEMRSLTDASRNNPEHFVWIRCLIMFGLKSEELVSLRCNDVDLESKLLRIRGFQGREDRYLKISPFYFGIFTERLGVKLQRNTYFREGRESYIPKRFRNFSKN